MTRAAAESAVERHAHLAARTAGKLRVDCHVHTMWSGDSTTTPDELAAAVSGSEMDVVCITDHSTIAGAERLAGELACRVIVGQEQRTPDGELIGLFLAERIPPGCRSALEAARAIRAQGGIVYAPHPFDPMRHRLRAEVIEQLAGEGMLDVIEAFNAKTSLESCNREAAAAAARLGVAAGAGSDSHVPEAIGAAYVEMAAFTGRDEFLASLRSGQVVGHHFDSHRPWRARVVPSLRDTSDG